MRAIGVICLVACGASAIAPATLPGPRAHAVDPDRAPIDPLVALTPDDAAELSWAIPGPILLELGGLSVAATGAGRPIEVAAFEEQGNLLRVAVRLEHARFSVWIDRAHLLSV